MKYNPSQIQLILDELGTEQPVRCMREAAREVIKEQAKLLKMYKKLTFGTGKGSDYQSRLKLRQSIEKMEQK